MSGWIKLHRSIIDHWIYQDADKLKAWIIILAEVNHKDTKVLIGDELFVCNRGESLNSLDTWALKFGKKWNKSSVRRFFKCLERDQMVVTKSERKTTRLTVCNYDKYQDERNADETQMKRKRNANETQMTPNKNEKNEKNEKNCYGETFLKFWEFYGKKGNKAKSYKQWQKLTIDQIEDIKHNLKSYIESTPDKQYRKNAEVYLNPANEHWNDEVISKEQKEKDNSFLKVSTKRTGVFA